MRPVITRLRRLDAQIDILAERMKEKKMKLYPSLVGPLLFIILGVTIMLLMPSQVKIRSDQVITARTFPTFLTMIMIGGSIILLLREGLKILRKEPIESIELELLTEVKALILMGLLILYAFLMSRIGFMVSSVIYSILMMYYFRVKNWKYYIIVIVAAVLIGIIFRYMLNVRLP